MKNMDCPRSVQLCQILRLSLEEFMAKAKSPSAPVEKKSRSKSKLSVQEQIALRAYEIYLQRNGAPGDPMQDWIRAEQEILASGKKRSSRSKVVSIAA
jgi:hypothetical protein